MHEQEPRLQPTGEKSRWLPIFLGITAALIVVTGGVFLWVLNGQVHDLRARLSGMEQRAVSAEQNALRKSEELNAVQSKLIATQQQTLLTEHRTSELEATNRESQAQLQQLRQVSETNAAAAAQARQEKQQALASRQEALGELENMRQRRVAELDRMQQALNHIAPTARTPTGMVVQLANKSFKFDFDSAALRPENREMLSRVAGVLLASEGYRLFIDGHTDDIGTDEYNQSLSERRAKSVRDYLVKAGVPAGIIMVKGFGKANPLVKAKTREAREKNRRVEIGIVDTIIQYDTTAGAKNQ
jgi:outer membrane protein OmpA-like peptidoglycan-associated protein